MKPATKDARRKAEGFTHRTEAICHDRRGNETSEVLYTRGAPSDEIVRRCFTFGGRSTLISYTTREL